MSNLPTTPATLPEYLLEKNKSMRVPKNRIETMKIGETCYTLPWAMEVNRERQCFLDSHYPTTPQPYKTSTLKVTRTAEGYVVDVPDDWAYKPLNCGDFGHWFIPVLQVVATQ